MVRKKLKASIDAQTRWLMTLSEVASETRASVSGVRQWIRDGKLASVKVGRRRLVKRTALEAMVKRAARQ